MQRGGSMNPSRCYHHRSNSYVHKRTITGMHLKAFNTTTTNTDLHASIYYENKGKAHKLHL